MGLFDDHSAENAAKKTHRSFEYGSPANEHTDSGESPAQDNLTEHSLLPPLEHGAGDRLVRYAYRLGVSGKVLSRPFGMKARRRLLATVENPLPGNPAAGQALQDGFYLFQGQKTPVSSVDLSASGHLSVPFAALVHGFAWLADLESHATYQEGASVAGSMVSRWLAMNGAPPAQPAVDGPWSIANTASRLLGWLIHAPLVLASDNKAERRQVFDAILGMARWLDHNVQRADNIVDEISGWSALLASGLLLPDGHPRQLYAEAGLNRALADGMDSEGMMRSRSPQAQVHVLARLIQLRACYRAIRMTPPDVLETAIAAMAPGLLACMHSDGSLGSWHGSRAVAPAVVKALCSAASLKPGGNGASLQAGYLRLSAGNSVVIMDAASPPSGLHGRFGCASTLAFELSHGAERIIVNCGGAEAAAGGAVPRMLEQGLRSSGAHSGLALDNTNSTAVLAKGGLGSGVRTVKADYHALTAAEAGGPVGASILTADHDGYVRHFGFIHRRKLTLLDDGTALLGEDILIPKSRRGKRRKASASIRFHLGPQVEPIISADGLDVRLVTADGGEWRFHSPGFPVELEESLWVNDKDVALSTRQLVIQGEISRQGSQFTWMLRKTG